jgi:hypothetical protein
VFTAAMKVLWSRLLIVGTGEVEDGAFPSLAVAATELQFEDIWNARHKPPAAAVKRLDEVLARAPAYARELDAAIQSLATWELVAPRAPRKRTKRTTNAEVPFSEPTAHEVYGEERDRLRVR